MMYFKLSLELYSIYSSSEIRASFERGTTTAPSHTGSFCLLCYESYKTRTIIDLGRSIFSSRPLTAPQNSEFYY